MICFPAKRIQLVAMPFGARPILFGSHSMSVATVSSLLCMVEVVCPIIYLSLDKYRICRIVWRFISAQEENETKRETHRIINLFNYSYCIARILMEQRWITESNRHWHSMYNYLQ